MWKIHYYSLSVQKEIVKLPKSLLAKYVHLTDLMIEFGPHLGMPHTRQIEKKLYELRIRGQDGIARVFFCSIHEKRIVMLHTFVKKTQKLPRKEIDIARKRLNEVMK